MRRGFKIRPLRGHDLKDVASNYYGYYEEMKRNPWLGLCLPERKPSMKEERKYFFS